jgi:hypothetical protein
MPVEDDSIHPCPAWVVREGIARLNVVGEGVSCQGQHHVVTPPGVVGGCGVQNDVDERTDIQNRSRLDVDVGDDGVFIRRRVGHGLLSWGRCGSQDQLLGGSDSLSFKFNDGGLLLIKELTSSQDVTTRGDGLLLDSIDSGGQGVKFLLEGLDIGD